MQAIFIKRNDLSPGKITTIYRQKSMRRSTYLEKQNYPDCEVERGNKPC